MLTLELTLSVNEHVLLVFGHIFVVRGIVIRDDCCLNLRCNIELMPSNQGG